MNLVHTHTDVQVIAILHGDFVKENTDYFKNLVGGRNIVPHVDRTKFKGEIEGKRKNKETTRSLELEYYENLETNDKFGSKCNINL